MPWKAWIQDRRVQIGAGIFLLLIVAAWVWIVQLSRLVDRRLQLGVHTNTVNIYSGAKTVAPGMALTPERVVAVLRRGGYREANSQVGTYLVTATSVEIVPGPASALPFVRARLNFEKGKLAGIVSLADDRKLKEYKLEPELITNLAGDNRERRRLLRFADVPKPFVAALLSAEDRKFFDHSGFDTPRLVKAVFVNLRSGRKEQGGSTLTMQLARNIWLDQGKTWRRKFTEMVIAGLLEGKLSKEEIFEHYVNEVYLGNAGSFEIHGFGEASWRYFNRDLARLNLAQTAMLAGVVQRPNYFDPVRHPDRAIARRNSILGLMVRNGYISQSESEQAQTQPAGTDPRGFDGGEAPYFVDLALDEAFHKLADSGGRTSLRIYTSLDPELQQFATDAVKIGMEKVDALLLKKQKGAVTGAAPQAALIALDPKTGQIRAAVGGRNYGSSQLNRVLAKRQPGSAFKPFVYTAAMETQLGGKKVFTGASILVDEPTTFKFGDEIYEPANFGQTYNGEVSLRQALAKSLNVPTVTLAEEVGYKKVADVARRAGITSEIKGTPALALGAYVMTPLEIAGAYTVFANQGKYTEPTFVDSIRRNDNSLYERKIEQKQALDPRVAFLMVDLLQDVMRSGTAGGVWSYGFRQPAAGKTGTSRDGWFAGFTAGLICVVWVGYDDNRDLNLEGAKSALPIWAEFMKRATQDGSYSGALPGPPTGIVTATIDKDSGLLAGPLCSGDTRDEFFIAGAEPKEECTETLAKSETNQPHRVLRESPTALVTDGKGMIGTALWYRPKNGESSDELIAAHPTLPSGTLLRVINLGNRKSVVVRIEGRIAATNGTVISLNQKAAQELDFARYGSATVKLEMAEKPAP